VKPYIVRASKRVIIKIREEDALLNILKSISENDQVEHFTTFGKRNYLQKARLISHEFPMFRPIVFEIGII